MSLYKETVAVRYTLDLVDGVLVCATKTLEDLYLDEDTLEIDGRANYRLSYLEKEELENIQNYLDVNGHFHLVEYVTEEFFEDDEESSPEDDADDVGIEPDDILYGEDYEEAPGSKEPSIDDVVDHAVEIAEQLIAECQIPEDGYFPEPLPEVAPIDTDVTIDSPDPIEPDVNTNPINTIPADSELVGTAPDALADAKDTTTVEEVPVIGAEPTDPSKTAETDITVAPEFPDVQVDEPADIYPDANTEPTTTDITEPLGSTPGLSANEDSANNATIDLATQDVNHTTEDTVKPEPLEGDLIAQQTYGQPLSAPVTEEVQEPKKPEAVAVEPELNADPVIPVPNAVTDAEMQPQSPEGNLDTNALLTTYGAFAPQAKPEEVEKIDVPVYGTEELKDQAHVGDEPAVLGDIVPVEVLTKEIQAEVVHDPKELEAVSPEVYAKEYEGSLQETDYEIANVKESTDAEYDLEEVDHPDGEDYEKTIHDNPVKPARKARTKKVAE